MKISARQSGEGVKVTVINKDSRIFSVLRITERDAERLAADIGTALQELDRKNRKLARQAEEYSQTA